MRELDFPRTVARDVGGGEREIGVADGDGCDGSIGVGLGVRGGEDHVLLPAERVVAAERAASRRENLGLHPREGGGRVDRLATPKSWLGRKLFQLAATD